MMHPCWSMSPQTPVCKMRLPLMQVQVEVLSKAAEEADLLRSQVLQLQQQAVEQAGPQAPQGPMAERSRSAEPGSSAVERGGGRQKAAELEARLQTAETELQQAEAALKEAQAKVTRDGDLQAQVCCAPHGALAGAAGMISSHAACRCLWPACSRAVAEGA